MPAFYVRKDLYDAIRDAGQDVKPFVNEAISEALKSKPVAAPKRPRVLNEPDACAFLDEHCPN